MTTMTTARLAPLASDDARARDPLLEELVQFAGYRPNALLTMARKPGLLAAVMELVQATIQAPGQVEPALRFLIACEVSRGAGCTYSTVHAAHAAHRAGVAWDKLEALPACGESPLYSARERAALSLARVSAQLPMPATGLAFELARQHFSETDLLEIASILALFGWFNRWNSLMQSQLEDEPARIGQHVSWLQSSVGRSPH